MIENQRERKVENVCGSSNEMVYIKNAIIERFALGLFGKFMSMQMAS